MLRQSIANLIAMAGIATSAVVAQSPVTNLPPIGVLGTPRTTVYERAKKAGGKLIWHYRADRRVVHRDLDQLSKGSKDIVIGRVLGHRPSLSADGKFITNDFLVKVQDVIKGDLPAGRSIFVSVPGGAYRFPDGTLAAVLPTGYRPPQERRIYVFFLKGNSRFKGHELVSEAQGLFDVTDGTVQSADMLSTDPLLTYNRMSVPSFLRELHTVIREKKK